MVAQFAKRTKVDKERVQLRRLTLEDRFCIRRWMRNVDMISYTVMVPGPNYAQTKPYSVTNADNYLKILMLSPDRRSFAICLDGEHVGNVGIKAIEQAYSRAECFIEIGAADHRGRGIGTHAMQRLMTYASDVEKLETLRLGVFEFNEPAIALYESLGFARTGTYGWHYAKRRYWEVYEMTRKSTPNAAT